jgi:hypothetical protein
MVKERASSSKKPRGNEDAGAEAEGAKQDDVEEDCPPSRMDQDRDRSQEEVPTKTADGYLKTKKISHCRRWPGKCDRGVHCAYAHGEHQLGQVVSDPALVKAFLCRFHKKGNAKIVRIVTMPMERKTRDTGSQGRGTAKEQFQREEQKEQTRERRRTAGEQQQQQREEREAPRKEGMVTVQEEAPVRSGDEEEARVALQEMGGEGSDPVHPHEEVEGG